ncbi:uncharacterized protein BYT42DRAFT_317544 [Radiomyces spectabilis]|uniref:uncharacterized protein n=1 Tax=Radiomyces spectabilis TaxID=64574 RepID=UPI00221FA844|nr:uncharacterized protein BYT42DRAFT_317544 [Radiomyces spectabilis]KAI8379201.1 hypothetical protein BYT42DRAFT_317544 [Radiomyces spectabilis]
MRRADSRMQPQYCRLKNIDKRRRRRCLDDDGNVICYSSECRQSRPALVQDFVEVEGWYRYNQVGQSWQNIIYPITVPQCKSANNDANPLIWDRDINAAVNMRRILQAYINSGCRIDSSRSPSNDAHKLRLTTKASSTSLLVKVKSGLQNPTSSLFHLREALV